MRREAEVQLLRSLGLGVGDDQEQRDDDKPDFDGGARESANESIDPEQEHNATIADLLQADRWRRHGV
jgi:hypothetical protein